MKKDDSVVNSFSQKKEVTEEKLIKKEEREQSNKGGYHDRTINTNKSANN